MICMCLPLGKCFHIFMISIKEPKRYNTSQVPDLIRTYETEVLTLVITVF